MSRLPGLLRRWLLSRPGSVALGLAMLTALVWFAAPYLGLRSVPWRLGIIAAIHLLVLLAVLVHWLLTRRRGDRLKAELEAQEEQGRLLEIEALKEKMDEAIASLRTSQLGVRHRGSAALYALPWFLLIGPSAAGKSTLLRNSGLNFPCAGGEDIDIRGFGGTRNCDWWFSDQAILLDTAGRYTTEEDDHEEWLAFLALLRRNRPRMPINGVIVAVSLADLLTADDEGLEWHVKVIRERIHELTTELGFVFPVFLVVTKCDLLEGFQAFFADLSEGERNQVWGCLLDGAGGEAGTEQVAAGLESLRQRLCEQRLRKMSIERNRSRKARIFDFPVQFEAAGERLLDFVGMLFRDNPYQEMPRYRGLYLTSGTQEGLPLQRVIGNLRQAFGFAEGEPEEEQARPRSYFVRELLHQVVFRVAGEASMNRRRQRISAWARSGALAGALAVVAGSVALLSGTYTAARLRAADTVDAAEGLQAALMSATGPAAGRARLQAFSEAWARYRRLLAQDRERPWYLPLAGSRGSEQIEPLRKVLEVALERGFLVPVARHLESRLDAYARQWDRKEDAAARAGLYEDYYATLRRYLLLHDPRRLDPAAEAPGYASLWRRLMLAAGGGPEEDGTGPAAGASPLTEEDANALVAMALGRLQAEGAAVTGGLSDALVETARADLRTPPDARVLYRRLRERGLALHGEVALTDLMEGRGSSYLRGLGRIPLLYTRRGWEGYAAAEIRRVADSASRGDWVLGTADEAAPEGGEGARARELERRLRRRYFDDYASTWARALKRVRATSFRNVADAANSLLVIGRADGPVASLLRLTGSQLDLREPAAGLPGEEVPAGALAAARPAVPEMRSRLRDLRAVALPQGERELSEPLELWLQAVVGLQAEVERLRGSGDVAREAERYAAAVMAGNASGREIQRLWEATTAILGGMDLRSRRVVEPLLMSPLRSTWRVLLSVGMGEVQARWEREVVQAFDEHIRGRFPFASGGTDAAVADVAEFFRPGDGILWSFVDNELSPYLSRHRSVWKEKRWLGVGPGFSAAFLDSLNRSHQISQALFRRGSDMPSFAFDLYPIPQPGLSEIVFEANGQVYRYRNEPQEWRRFDWPGDFDQGGARLLALSTRSHVRYELSADGLWGVLELLRKAQLTHEQGTQYLSQWRMEGPGGAPVEVAFRLKLDRHTNVLSPGLLEGMRLPARLAGGGAGGQRVARN